MENNLIDYNECYLRACENLTKWRAAMGDSCNENYWFYKELRQAIEYYKALANVK